MASSNNLGLMYIAVIKKTSIFVTIVKMAIKPNNVHNQLLKTRAICSNNFLNYVKPEAAIIPPYLIIIY